ncbi:hypothetical protein EA658_10070 [Pseudoxanthomonas winnipegensis]|uniref:Uncharacterized protein n=1 Tax=Pseudoxanthomonas winnipegensis TaxID=2480810 RepID=A0ABY1WCY7_9GAMM|nr:hypothetical protein [Pseudoxanthomonas winnipegensis]TAA12424.1 hypothetical protein EA659_03580 [Pseudoxanthomonas winnipegensis]TAA19210.1 hypothetical protein EA658_10070 [Pseudoxanthomonas winnipegensis]TAH70471.1 hypothetical protein EA657_17135 [Pseudoxanthomonas winnipegensis]
MVAKVFHCHLSVRGAVRWPKRELRGLFRSTKTGKLLTPEEAREVLFEHLAQGHEVIPCDQACEGFDYSGKGCPGHTQPQEAL